MSWESPFLFMACTTIDLLEDLTVNKTYLLAGAVIMVGVVMMALATAMLLAMSPDYWDAVGYGTREEVIQKGTEADQYGALFHVGLIVVFIGIAVMAFGLASARSETMRYRPPETVIPPVQYQPGPPGQE